MDTPNDIFENLRCIVCFDLAREAVECLLCGNIFCKRCVSNIKCPLCRNHSTYKDSGFARRIIDSMPVKCPDCNLPTTKGALEGHLLICSERVFTCKMKDCTVSCKKEEFAQHLNQSHHFEVLNDFDVTYAKMKTTHFSLFNDKINAAGKPSRRGSTGKFYCGERSDIRCSGCDGNCGPTNGCQCSSCMKLDMEFYKLPPGFILNHDGNFAELINEKFYCGIRIGNSVYCTPEHQICMACNKTTSQVLIKDYVKAAIENSIKEVK